MATELEFEFSMPSLSVVLQTQDISKMLGNSEEIEAPAPTAIRMNAVEADTVKLASCRAAIHLQAVREHPHIACPVMISSCETPAGADINQIAVHCKESTPQRTAANSLHGSHAGITKSRASSQGAGSAKRRVVSADPKQGHIKEKVVDRESPRPRRDRPGSASSSSSSSCPRLPPASGAAKQSPKGPSTLKPQDVKLPTHQKSALVVKPPRPASAPTPCCQQGSVSADEEVHSRLTKQKASEQLTQEESATDSRAANEQEIAETRPDSSERRVTREHESELKSGQDEEQAKQRCSICFDDASSEKGLECVAASDSRHFICSECFQEYVNAKAGEELRLVRARNAQISCPVPGCGSKPWSDAVVARHVPDSVFTQYLESAAQIREESLNRELERKFEQKLEAEIKRRDALTKENRWLEDARRHVIDRILTLACPRCGQAFLDFEGCFALTCSRCQCGFCAYCLADCGNDAHDHVRRCAENQTKDFFGSIESFEDAQRKRRRQMLTEYLRPVSAERRAKLLRSLQKELNDLGLGNMVTASNSGDQHARAANPWDDVPISGMQGGRAQPQPQPQPEPQPQLQGQAQPFLRRGGGRRGYANAVVVAGANDAVEARMHAEPLAQLDNPAPRLDHDQQARMRGQRLARFDQPDAHGRANREAAVAAREPGQGPQRHRWFRDEEIANVCQIFPELDQSVVKLALVQAGGVENAVEFLMGTS